MKKELMMALAAAMIAMPAMANEHDTAMDKTEKLKMKAEKFMTEADTDKNGMISKAEHTAAADKMFTEADSNKDGNVSHDELVAAKKAEWEKMENMKPSTGNN